MATLGDEKSLTMFSHFDKILACNGQTFSYSCETGDDRYEAVCDVDQIFRALVVDRRLATAYSTLCIASLSNNKCASKTQ